MDVSSSFPRADSVVRPPSPADVDAIAALADPVVRNLRITQAYHLLSAGFGALGAPGANWCTFAVWASRQAGQTIRGEDLLDSLEHALRCRPALLEEVGRVWKRLFLAAIEHPGSRRSLLLRLLASGAFAHASDAVARGNRKVFEEIGREFARFLALRREGPIGPAALAEFLASLAPGPPPDGQDSLRRAFSAYAAALEATDARRRAELLLLGNLEIGLHEQTRLQPEILEALEVPYTTMTHLGRCILEALFPGSGEWTGPVRTPVAALVGGAGRASQLALRGVLRHLITEVLMTLALPGEVLHLGRDLRGDPPASLRDPADPALRELLGRLAPAAGDRTGAYDWSVLRQRMVLIARLFRLRQEEGALLGAPFTAEQVRAMEAGRVPGGDL